MQQEYQSKVDDLQQNKDLTADQLHQQIKIASAKFSKDKKPIEEKYRDIVRKKQKADDIEVLDAAGHGEKQVNIQIIILIIQNQQQALEAIVAALRKVNPAELKAILKDKNLM